MPKIQPKRRAALRNKSEPDRPLHLTPSAWSRVDEGRDLADLTADHVRAHLGLPATQADAESIARRARGATMALLVARDAKAEQVRFSEATSPARRLILADTAERAEHEDPDAPGETVRVVRRVWAYDHLHRRGVICDGMREACDWWAVMAEAASGARWMNGELNGRTDPRFRGHPVLSQLQAQANLGRAKAVLGLYGSATLRLLVEENLQLDQIAARRKQRPEVTKGEVLATIRRLAEHRGIEV